MIYIMNFYRHEFNFFINSFTHILNSKRDKKKKTF